MSVSLFLLLLLDVGRFEKRDDAGAQTVCIEADQAKSRQREGSHESQNVAQAASIGTPYVLALSMIPKSGHRFSEKIMLHIRLPRGVT